MITVITSRTTIRNVLPANCPDLRTIILDKETSPDAVYDHPFPTGEQEVRQLADWFSQQDSFLVVCESASGKVIGYITMIPGETGRYDFGYCLHSSYQGQGFATEACTALIDYAFSTLGAEVILCGIAVANGPYRRRQEKLGFRKTGEHLASFRKNDKGVPIEFTGASFALSREIWQQTH